MAFYGKEVDNKLKEIMENNLDNENKELLLIDVGVSYKELKEKIFIMI